MLLGQAYQQKETNKLHCYDMYGKIHVYTSLVPRPHPLFLSGCGLGTRLLYVHAWQVSILAAAGVVLWVPGGQGEGSSLQSGQLQAYIQGRQLTQGKNVKFPEMS